MSKDYPETKVIRSWRCIDTSVDVLFYSFFQILLQRSSLEALSFLQETLSPVSSPSDPEEQQDLKSLFTTLVRGSKGKDDAMDPGGLHCSNLRKRNSGLKQLFQHYLQVITGIVRTLRHFNNYCIMYPQGSKNQLRRSRVI